MSPMAQAHEKEALGVDLNGFKPVGGVLANTLPHLSWISSPAIIVREEGVVSGLHAEDGKNWSANYLIYGSKTWECLSMENVELAKPLINPSLDRDYINWEADHENI